MKDIFAITNFIDTARWSNSANYSIINYANPNLELSKKILTHYITYITDRQMPFQRIWDIGGFVFSRLVEEYSSKKSICYIYSNYIEDTDTKQEIKTNTTKLSFKCKISTSQLDETQKEKLQLTDEESQIIDKNIEFRSRFVTTDFCSIYQTLYILEELADCSLIEYIKLVIELHKDPKTETLDDKYRNDIIKRIAYALYILTYQNNKIKDKNTSIKDYIIEVINGAKSQRKEVKQILKSKKRFEEGYNHFTKNQIFHCKRLWCALRDYMKGTEFRDYFRDKIAQILGDNISDIHYLRQLELPGDVWNNNSTFINCNFPNKGGEIFNKYLRKEFEDSKNQIVDGYVEQFDITFSLAPRMCEMKLCDLCPYGILKCPTHKFQQLCINDTSKYCPIMLHSTGYVFECIGKENCTLCHIFKRKP